MTARCHFGAVAVLWILVSGTACGFYNPQQGRWLSREPLGEAGSLNLYSYCANNPINFIDPSGLRWVDVYIWNWEGWIPKTWPGNRVGHAMITEHDSQKVILSQFPVNSPLLMPGRGDNRTLDYWDTFTREGSGQSTKFSVFVPDDAKFDATVADHVARSTWTMIPASASETHCARAAYDALQAGGVPLSGQDDGQLLPGNFGTMLEDLMAMGSAMTKWHIRYSK